MTESDDAAEQLRVLTRHAGQLRHRQSLFVNQRPRGDVQLFRLPATTKLAASFDEINAQGARRIGGLTPIQYQSGRVIPEGHVMWTRTSEVPLLTGLNLDDKDGPELIEGYESDDFQIRHLKLTATSTETRETTAPLSARFFRIMRPAAKLNHQNKVAAWFTGSAFDTLDNDIMLFPSNVDAISIGYFTFFVNVSNFVRSFQFAEQMRAAARETFDSVLADLEIDGMDPFRAAATSDLTMVTKMTSIQRKMEKYPQYRDSLTMTNLLKFIDSHPSIDIETEGSGEARRFKFSNDPKHRFKILKLLDDDYLRSDLTQYDYEVDSKGEPSV